VRRREAVLQPRDVQETGLQIHLVPAQRDELRDAQPMSVGDQNERAIARPMPPELPRRLQGFSTSSGVKYSRLRLEALERRREGRGRAQGLIAIAAQGPL
jgi:hypothetical protein